MSESVIFSRGTTFSFLMKVPDTITEGQLLSYRPKAQLRKYKSSQPNGLIADLNCFWADPKTTMLLSLYHNLTDDWPVGLAELDVLFEGANGSKLRSTTVQIQITRGITK